MAHLCRPNAAGDTLLAEWTGGKLHLYGTTEGSWRTVTNSPDFPTQRAMREYDARSGTEAATALNGPPSSLLH